MYTLNRLKITGFRRLFEFDLKIRSPMVMIGANGVGKTSVLDVFSLLASSASGKLAEKLSELGGFSSVLTRDKATKSSFLVEMGVPNHKPLEYELRLSQQAMGYAIESETLTQLRPEQDKKGPFKHIDSRIGEIRFFDPKQERFVRPDWQYSVAETSLSQVPKMFKEPEALRHILGGTTLYHTLDVGPRAPVKLPQQMKPALMPGIQGEDLAPFLYYLREENPDRYETIIDTLKSAFRDFEILNFPPVAAGMLTVTWKDRNFQKPLYLNELSEGTLRFLWLVSLLQSPVLPAVTMIDEPEVSLHPELLAILADVIRSAAKRTQLIIVTHSDRLIRYMEPSEVVVMDISEDGFTQAAWADNLDLDTWLHDYSMDEVWRMGRMGGRS